jgi:hypothetical protein
MLTLAQGRPGAGQRRGHRRRQGAPVFVVEIKYSISAAGAAWQLVDRPHLLKRV